MRPITVTVGPLAAASGTAVAASQTVTAGNSVVINGSAAAGGIATLDTPRQIIIVSAGNDSGIAFAVTGTNHAGNPVGEMIAGANAGTATSALDYATVTSIKPSGATAGAITAGTNGVAGSAWVRFDEYARPAVSIQIVVAGTANYTLQQTLDDPNSTSNPISPAAVQWLPTTDTSAVGATSSVQTNYGFPPLFARVLLNSGSGSVRATFVQSGNAES